MSTLGDLIPQHWEVLEGELPGVRPLIMTFLGTTVLLSESLFPALFVPGWYQDHGLRCDFFLQTSRFLTQSMKGKSVSQRSR